MDDGSAAAIVSAVQATLPASVVPWTVTAERRSVGAWTISLTHEASNGLVFETADTDVASAIRTVVGSVRDNAEVRRIGQAPKLDHPDVVAGIRTLVQCFGWSRTEVGAVAALFEEFDSLSAKEAEWITRSFGEEKPPPRATRIL
jgi:hypothetical protein